MRRGTLLRFTLLHVATYFVMGVTFYVLQDYAAAFASEGASALSFLGFGTPELFVQMLVFSALLMAWERRRAKARGAPFGPGG